MCHIPRRPSRRAAERVLGAICSSLVCCLAIVLGSCMAPREARAAEPLTVGLHLATAHTEGGLNAVNPGVYVRTASGWGAGAYRNSINRLSIHAGRQFDAGPFSLYVGLVSGYKLRTDRREWCSVAAYGPALPCADGLQLNWVETERGWSKSGIAPLISPSVRIDLAEGYSARLAYLHKPSHRGGGAGLHLSVERGF